LELANSHSLILVGIEGSRAIEGLEALVNLVPADRRSWALDVLARQLRAVVAQISVPRRDGQGSVLATELLLNNEETNDFLREGHLRLLEPLMERGAGGMHALKNSLRRLADNGLIVPPQSAQFSEPVPPERPKPAPQPAPRRERVGAPADTSRLEPPPEEPPAAPARYALSAPPRPPVGPVASPRITSSPSHGNMPQSPATLAPAPVSIPEQAPDSPKDSGDDALMGWL
jgi:hypothetical protein